MPGVMDTRSAVDRSRAKADAGGGCATRASLKPTPIWDHLGCGGIPREGGGLQSRMVSDDSRLSFWQQEKERCSVSDGAFHADRAAMIENNMLYDGQTKSGTAAFARARFVDAIKA